MFLSGIATLLFSLVLIPMSAHVADPRQESLQGLERVHISVYTKHMELLPLNEEVVRQDVRTRIENAGLHIIDDDTTAGPMLQVRVFTEAIHNALAVNVRLELFQDTALVRQPNVRVFASTWVSEAQYILSSEAETEVASDDAAERLDVSPAEEIRAHVWWAVDRFILQYKLANKRAGSATPSASEK